MSVFNIKLQTLSPVHIGDGNELRQGFDFMVNGNHTYRLDEDAILQAKIAQVRPDRAGHYPTPGALLNEADFERGEYFRYVLRGAARSSKTDARLKSFIKDVYDRPYIPGSSLKGALRTALAWHGWKDINIRLDRGLVGTNRSWAGQRIERKIFGPDPNHDLLRALHVSDLFGPQEPGGGLMVVNAQVLTKRTMQTPVELETLPGEVGFSGTLTIDETLFAPFAERELGFSNRRQWLDELAVRAQKHSLARIELLADWFGHADPAYAPLANFYNDLASVKLSANQALLQIGWGAGWDGKTFWTHLQKNEFLFEQLVKDFHMNKAGSNSRREPGDAFPRSKRAAMSVKQGIARPVAPSGWVLFEMDGGEVNLLAQRREALEQDRPVVQINTPTPAASPLPAPQEPQVTTPAEPTARPIPEKPQPESKIAPKEPLTESFSEIPKPGARFRGLVWDVAGDKIQIQIPGLSVEDTAVAIYARDQYDRRKYKLDDEVYCTVISVEEDPDMPGYRLVHCVNK